MALAQRLITLSCRRIGDAHTTKHALPVTHFPLISRMRGLYTLGRARSSNAHVYQATLVDADEKLSPARGLCAGSSDFQRGDFIGFYTGRWTTGPGRGDYVVEFGDDVWRRHARRHAKGRARLDADPNAHSRDTCLEQCERCIGQRPRVPARTGQTCTVRSKT